MTRLMNHLETERLILRPFTEQDAEALFAILSDRDVNTFLPMFPLKNLEEAKAYIKDKHAAVHAGETLLYYAICRKEAPAPIGYVHVSGNDSHDLGYGLKKEFWHKGFCTEACQAVIGQLKQTGIPYITATHDVNNPRSGKVMQALGMKYQYSYEELWQPKNFLVTFRMYQLNFDKEKDRVYRKYWDKYPVQNSLLYKTIQKIHIQNHSYETFDPIFMAHCPLHVSRFFRLTISAGSHRGMVSFPE